MRPGLGLAGHELTLGLRAPDQARDHRVDVGGVREPRPPAVAQQGVTHESCDVRGLVPVHDHPARAVGGLHVIGDVAVRERHQMPGPDVPSAPTRVAVEVVTQGVAAALRLADRVHLPLDPCPALPPDPTTVEAHVPAFDLDDSYADLRPGHDEVCLGVPVPVGEATVGEHDRTGGQLLAQCTPDDAFGVGGEVRDVRKSARAHARHPTPLIRRPRQR